MDWPAYLLSFFLGATTVIVLELYAITGLIEDFKAVLQGILPGLGS